MFACFIICALHSNVYSRCWWCMRYFWEKHIIWNVIWVSVFGLHNVHDGFYCHCYFAWKVLSHFYKYCLDQSVCIASCLLLKQLVWKITTGQLLSGSQYSITQHPLPLLTKHIYFQEPGENGKGKDFISLGLQNGHLVFRWLSPVTLYFCWHLDEFYFQLI